MSLTQREVAERLVAVLERNGEESLRETARRLGLAPSTLHAFMARHGYEAQAVTKWSRRPSIPVDSREHDSDVPSWMLEPPSSHGG